MSATLRQEAPWPAELEVLVAGCAYRPGWTFRLVADLERDFGPDPGREQCIGRGTTLVITTCGYNSYHPERGENYRVHHYMVVPPATYDRRSWQRWLFEQLLLVERHEAMEFFQVDGERPYAPSHGPGNDPYIVREVGTEADRRTSFRGEVDP